MSDTVHAGNAYDDGEPYRGWLLGHFVEPAGSPRHSDAVEVKWDVHKAGDERASWVETDGRSALCVLFSGRIRLSFPDADVVLAAQGDYVTWRGVGHTWRVEEDCVAVVVRWPSVPGYGEGPGPVANAT